MSVRLAVCPDTQHYQPWVGTSPVSQAPRPSCHYLSPPNPHPRGASARLPAAVTHFVCLKFFLNVYLFLRERENERA